MEAFLGRWKLDDAESLDAMVKRLGGEVPTAQVEAILNTDMSIEKDGDLYYIHNNSPVKDFGLKFHLGQEFEQTTLSGKKIKTCISLEGNKLKWVDYREKLLVVEFELKDSKITITVSLEKLKSVRHYSKL